MSPICKKVLLTFIVCVISSSLMYGQFTSSKYEVGLNLGPLVYQGDLSKSYLGDYKSLKPALGLYVSKSLDSYFGIRANLNVGKINADESLYYSPEWKRFRNFKFSSSVIELSAMLVFNPIGNNYNSGKVTPYLVAGAGIAFLNIKRDWSSLNTNVYDAKSNVQLGLAIDTVHSLPGIIPVLPVGGGIRYAIGSQLSLNAEATYRFTATDYLDGFRYSANGKKRDSYYGLTIGVSYRFGGYKCPPAR